MLPKEAVSEVHGFDVASRAEQTIAIIHNWGYAPELETLAASLLGGGVSLEALVGSLVSSENVTLRDGFVYLRGYEELLGKSKVRVASNRRLNGRALAIAEDFTQDLVRLCPFVDCVALSGSVASGGYVPEDDIDFDLFVRNGTRYICYLIATLLGLKYAWRYRQQAASSAPKTLFLPKVTCINVVWSDEQTRPFARQDEALAFELLQCRPLYGIQRFCAALDDNTWIMKYFPQIYQRIWNGDVTPKKGSVGRLLEGLGRRPWATRAMDATCKALSWILYHFVQWTRRGDPQAVARMEFLRRVKYPYEIF